MVLVRLLQPPAPQLPLDGFRIVEEPPSAAVLVPKDPAQQTVDRCRDNKTSN